MDTKRWIPKLTYCLIGGLLGLAFGFLAAYFSEWAGRIRQEDLAGSSGGGMIVIVTMPFGLQVGAMLGLFLHDLRDPKKQTNESSQTTSVFD